MSFDVDWMRGQSIGIYPITNSGPEPIIAELEKIVDSGENGLNQNLVKLQPVARLNAIMVVTKKPALLHTVENWIKRLDRSDSTRTSVHVYKVKYGDAKQIARVLTDMFGGGSSNSSLLDSADNQIAPGSGTSASGSDRVPSATTTTIAATAPAAAIPPRNNRAAASVRAWVRLLAARKRRQRRQSRPAGQGEWLRLRRTAAPAKCPDHPRRRQQFASDLRRSGQLQDH